MFSFLDFIPIGVILMLNIADYIRSVYDFPHEGIHFRDITTLLEDAAAFKQSVKMFAESVKKFGPITKIAAPEARGFVFATPLAVELGTGFIPIRKPGKLPYKTVSQSFDLEYGSDMLQIHEGAIKPGERVLLVDDLLATGGTMRACKDLVESQGATVVAIAFLLELTSLEGRKKLDFDNVISLVQYE